MEDMLLKENENYLYLAKADLIENTLPAKLTTVTVFACQDFIFCIPIKEFRSYLLLQQSRRFHYFEGVNPSEGLRRLLDEEGLTLEEAERRLRTLLEKEGSCRIFEIKDLEMFRMSTGLLGQALLMQAPDDNRFQLMIKGRKDRRALKAFYGL